MPDYPVIIKEVPGGMAIVAVDLHENPPLIWVGVADPAGPTDQRKASIILDMKGAVELYQALGWAIADTESRLTA